MKRSFKAGGKLLLFFIFIFNSSLTAQTWEQLPDFPSTERDDGVAFVIGDKAFCGTGLLPWWVPTLDFYSLNFTTDTWSAIAGMTAGEERQYACGFSHNGKGYVFGGRDAGSNPLNDLWIYDTTSNSWSELSPLPGDGRAGASCFVLGDTAYLVGGSTPVVAATNEVWAYAILTDTWIQKPNLPGFGRWRACAAAANGKGYVLGGVDDNSSFRKEMFEYNPANGQWTHVSDFPLPGRTYSGMAELYGNLYLLAGMDTSITFHNDFWEYNTTSASWTSLAPLPDSARKGGMCFSSANSIFYTTGIIRDGTRLRETWKIFNPNGIEEPKTISTIRVYPNPCTTQVNIVTPYSDNSVMILSSQGEIVHSSNYASKNIVIDTGHLVSGLYFVYIRNGIKNTGIKLVVY